MMGLLVVVACGDAIRTPHELREPLIWYQSRGLCGRVYAVDVDGHVFRDPGGCEDGAYRLKETGKTSSAKSNAVIAAFEALPEAGPVFIDCRGNVDTFTRLIASHTVMRSVCAPTPSFDDSADLPEPHRALAQLFLALP
ncbi:MAG TPA: hypothetical protein VGG33_24930 [Polyangia bacterium]